MKLFTKALFVLALVASASALQLRQEQAPVQTETTSVNVTPVENVATPVE
jgi:hypothetical protein